MPQLPSTQATVHLDLPYPVCRPALALAERVLDHMKVLDYCLVQDQRTGEKICLYLHPIGYPKVPVINYTVWSRKVADTVVQFELRRMSFVPAEIWSRLSYQNPSVRTAFLRPSNFDEVMGYAQAYLANVLPAVRNGTWKVGTDPERVVHQALEVLHNGLIMPYHAPDNLRALIGHRRTLDFWLKELNIGVEVDGPHHYREMKHHARTLAEVQAADREKDAACAQLGIAADSSEGRRAALRCAADHGPIGQATV